jgi:hypothetical protein
MAGWGKANAMETMITTDEDGESQTHVGITICEGPGRFRMVLTRPYHEAGRIIEIPREKISSIEPVAPGSFGETPEPASQEAHPVEATAAD